MVLVAVLHNQKTIDPGCEGVPIIGGVLGQLVVISMTSESVMTMQLM
jgi:hypothetical protein